MKAEERRAIERMTQELKRRPELAKAQRKFAQFHAERQRMELQRNRKMELDRLLNEIAARHNVPAYYLRRRDQLEKMIKDSLPYN